MTRRLRLNSETLKVLSQSQAQRVVGATAEACVTNDCTEDTCVTVTSTDYTWIWCDYCRDSCYPCVSEGCPTEWTVCTR